MIKKFNIAQALRRLRRINYSTLRVARMLRVSRKSVLGWTSGKFYPNPLTASAIQHLARKRLDVFNYARCKA